MPDYSKGKIYRLVCNVTGLQYIGSTIQTLAQRKTKHVSDYKREKKYCGSFKVIESKDYDIILIENWSCKNKEELHARERYWIENTTNTNLYVPRRTKKEYYMERKEELLYKMKQYYNDNKEDIRTYKIRYREENKEKISQYKKQELICECGSHVSRSHHARHQRTKKHQNWLKSCSPCSDN